MNRIKIINVVFCVLVIGILAYSYIIGKNISTISEINFNDLKKVQPTQAFAGFEGDDRNVLEMNVMYDEKADNFDYLYQASDLIVKIKLQDRKQYMSTLCSDVEVLQVYKGDTVSVGNSIKIYEPVGYTDKESLSIFGAYLPMREYETYIVFLKLENNNRYNFVSSLYGKYNTEKDLYIEVKEDKLSKEDMINNDMISFISNDESQKEMKEQLKNDGYNEEEIRNKIKGYERLMNLKETRDSIRSSFSQLIPQVK